MRLKISVSSSAMDFERKVLKLLGEPAGPGKLKLKYSGSVVEFQSQTGNPDYPVTDVILIFRKTDYTKIRGLLSRGRLNFGYTIGNAWVSFDIQPDNE